MDADVTDDLFSSLAATLDLVATLEDVVDLSEAGFLGLGSEVAVAVLSVSVDLGTAGLDASVDLGATGLDASVDLSVAGLVASVCCASVCLASAGAVLTGVDSVGCCTTGLDSEEASPALSA